MQDMEAIRQTFFDECDEQLSELEAGLLQIQSDGPDAEIINAVFRAVHSIKGGAGAFQLSDLVQFAHTFETTLECVRSDKLDADAELLAVMLRASDMLADLVSAARGEGSVEEAAWRSLVEELSQYCDSVGEVSEDFVQGDVDFQPVGITLDDLFSETDDEETFQEFVIQFAPWRDLYAHANDPILLFKELSRLGDATVSCDTSDIPTLGNLEPDGSYLSWIVRLKTTETASEIADVFEFVEDSCDLVVEEVCPFEEPSQSSTLPDGANGSEVRDPDGAAESVQTQMRSIDDDVPTVGIGNGQGNAQLDAVNPPICTPAPKPEKLVRQQTIRADVERIDHLVNLVGELVINQSMLSRSLSGNKAGISSEINVALEEFEQLIRAIQEGVMAIRAQPVQPMFQRMSRVVREALAATGKSARLETQGEMTEVDKTVLEKLSDPLTHMIRNAIDHGLEDPDTRIERGKPAEGVVRLSAAHRSGRVVIEISDDGAGIDRERVFDLAVQKGLIGADANLSDNEIDNLIFAPGFSTSSTVSDLSGRGVGMDVVRQSIQALGGRVSISSHPGQGSTFSLSLPLTLAVLDGMVVSIRNQTMIIPINSILETFRPTPADIQDLGCNARLVSVRDEFAPLIDVGEILGFKSCESVHDAGVVVLVETEDGTAHALLVDAIDDQIQVVIKSLEQNYGQIPGVAAATILGTGQVALIADVEGLIACARENNRDVPTDVAAPLVLAG